jgi:hypothetical protein
MESYLGIRCLIQNLLTHMFDVAVTKKYFDEFGITSYTMLYFEISGTETFVINFEAKLSCSHCEVI